MVLKSIISEIIRKIWLKALDTFFPIFCIGCGKEGAYVCGACFRAIPRQQQQVCPLCYKAGGNNESGTEARRAIELGGVCEACKSAHPDFALDSLVCACEYKDATLMARLIHNYKYEFVQDLAGPLGEILKEKVADSFGAAGAAGSFDFDAITFVPLHPKRLRWRGFNQSQRLAEIVATGHASGHATDAANAKTVGHLKLPCLNLLNRLTFSKPQMELTKEQRAVNVLNAFAPIQGQEMPENVLIIDDVATTLATLEACASQLKKAGVKKVFALVLARVY
jgi:predicted amidophosphoribosyltransferase